MITIQHKGKTYICKEVDHKKGTYSIITNDGILDLAEEEIQAVIMPIEEYKKIKYGRFTKPKPETKEE